MAVLVVVAHGRRCALALRDVVEVMRPLPIDGWPGKPDVVLGLSIVRGAPTAVVDLARILGGEGGGAPTRFVTVRVKQRSVALAVDSVSGIARLDAARLAELPPLLGAEATRRVEALAELDRELLVLLEAGKLIDDALEREIGERVRTRAAAGTR